MELAQNNEQQKYIAETILSQIKAIDPWAMMAYGAKNMLILNENNMYQGGISFNVNGYRHKGMVQITLMWNDTYRIQTFNRTKTKVKDEQSEVYFDMLVYVLDGFVEGAKDD